MKIQIRERNVEVTDELRAHVERRLGFALSRFGERIAQVQVRFSSDGHGGGFEKRCQIDVGLRARNVRVDATDVDPSAAVDHAADRVSRAIGHALDREREWRDGPSRPRIFDGLKT